MYSNIANRSIVTLMSVVSSPWIARLGVNLVPNIEFVPISISELQVSNLENEVPNMEFSSAPWKWSASRALHPFNESYIRKLMFCHLLNRNLIQFLPARPHPTPYVRNLNHSTSEVRWTTAGQPHHHFEMDCLNINVQLFTLKK